MEVNIEEKKQRLREIIEQVFMDPVFRTDGINSILGKEYVENAIDGLVQLVDRMEIRLPKGYENDPEIFSNFLEKFFMNDEVYHFSYDGNTSKAYNRDDDQDLFEYIKSKVGQELSRKDRKVLNKVLAHTFFPLINGVDNNLDNRRAICSGYAQLACILSAYFGFEYYPTVAQVKEEDGEEIAYPYAHYLCTISNGDKAALVDLQSANSLYRINTKDDNPNDIDIEQKKNETLESIRQLHRRCDLIYASPVEYSEFNERKFTHGGLGEDSSVAVVISKKVPQSVIKPPDFSELIENYNMKKSTRIA